MMMRLRFINPWTIPLFITIYSNGTECLDPHPFVSQFVDMV